MSDEKWNISLDLYDESKSYTGLPGAVACEIIGKFTDYFDTCEKWELDDKYWGMNAEWKR